MEGFLGTLRSGADRVQFLKSFFFADAAVVGVVFEVADAAVGDACGVFSEATAEIVGVVVAEVHDVGGDLD